MQAIIIGDPGSCHMGNFEQAKKLIRVGLDCGLDAVKFQLFPKDLTGNNIYLPFEWFPQLKEYGESLGIEVFASVWDIDGFNQLMDAGCKSIKFSYTQRDNKLIERALEVMASLTIRFDRVYISGPVLHTFPENAIKLFCIPEYPVLYDPCFDGIFPMFDGFSDHTLGYRNTIRAVQEGATIIEKHFTLDLDTITCPDHKFALKPDHLYKMCKELK